MDYDGDALDKNTLKWCSILVKFAGVAIRKKNCLCVVFSCYDVGKLSRYLLCSIPEVTRKHQRVSFLPAEHAAFRKEQLNIVIDRQVLSALHLCKS